MLVRVYVTPKRGILDPQGKAVARSLHDLGYVEAGEVRMGKYIEIELHDLSKDEAERRMEDMCRRLLANSVIEDFRFEVGEE